MITLKSDNRVLTSNSKYSYLVDNYPSGVSTVTIVNTDGFSTNDFILIEEFGKEVAEIFRVGSVNATTGDITLLATDGSSTNTTFSHMESTKVYVLPYDQIRFYWTASAGDITDEEPTFGTGTPLTGWVDLEPAAWYTTFDDINHSTGFGWFVYKNSITAESSQESNPIPYAGFSENTVAQVFADFDSLLNSNELKLVTMGERFSWLNESLAMLKNKLNLNNVEYFVSTEKTLNIVAGTAEYILDSDFSDLVYINDGDRRAIPYMNVQKAGTYTGDYTYHYLRNRYIGFTPTPASDATYKYKYRSKASTVSSVSTYLDLPDNAFYSLKDFMMYRACLKFGNPMANTYYEAFINSVNHYVQAAVKRDANLDSWEPAPYANV